jgi:hypothetical protein
VFVPDNHPAYISWEQYQSNLRTLQQQRRRGPVPGPARTTTAVLAGLVVCGQCGCRMQTHYTQTLRYDCQRHRLDEGASVCQSLVGAPLEQLVATQLLHVVSPASLEMSLRAAQEWERERAALDRHWRLRLERAQQDADRAFRQYHAVEPENRLVARTLERQWEAALRTQRTLQEEYDRFQQTQPTRLRAAERTQIEALARDLPALWHAPQTSVIDKRQVARLLLQQVVVWAPAASQEVKVQLHWSGGPVTEHRWQRRVRSWEQVSDAAAVAEQVRAGQAAGWTSRRIAAALNERGHRTPHGKAFTAESVRQLRLRLERAAVNAKRGRRPKKPKGSVPDDPQG